MYKKCSLAIYNSFLLGCLTFFCFIPLTSLAASEEEKNESAHEEESTLEFSGWASQGFTWNTSASDNFNGPVTFNDRANEYQLNQLYFIAKKDVTGSSENWDLGGRIDLLYGSDAAFTTAVGLDNEITSKGNSRFYSLAIPQFYLEANIPVLEGVKVKAGHFYTLIGYEVVTAPDNFFYSHAYTMQYGEPFTHVGALASTSFNDGAFTITGGLVRGWDNLSDGSDNNLSFMGGFSAAPSESTSLTFSVISGNEGVNANRTMYSAVLSQLLTEKLSYVLQHDYGVQELDGGSSAEWYGINQYLFYRYSDLLTPGLRFEWFRDNNGTRVAGLRSGAVGGRSDYYSLTAGVNVKPCEYFTLRPEVRWDFQDDYETKAYNDGEDDSQLLVSIDAIVKF
jgi:Putative beta-barrel porin-2, OmpL-like. bbp2